MRNLFLVTCFFITVTVFAQQNNVVVKDSAYIPSSIFALNSLDNQQYEGVVGSLRLTGYKFMIVDSFNNYFSSQRISFDTRNIGRYYSSEDMMDNYNKAQLNKYDVTRNNDHFIWNTYQNRHIWKQWQQPNEQIKQ